MAERKDAFAQAFAQPLHVLDSPAPIQRRAATHNARAQRRQNA
jgi:hypothetical protein